MEIVETQQRPFGTAQSNITTGSVAHAHTTLDEELLLFNAETSEMLVVPQEHAKAFLQEANQMQSLVQKLNHSRDTLLELEEKLTEAQAKRPTNPLQINTLTQQISQAKKAYEAAYEDVKKELGEKGYLTPGGDGKKLLELLPLAKRRDGGQAKDWARKWTYVRSDKVKSHFRSYKLNSAEASQGKSFLRNGKVDTGELKKQFSKLEPKLKAEWNAGVNGFIFPNVQQWVDCLNVKADESKPVKFSSSVHLFRYFAGCGASTEWNPKGGKIGGKINGKAEVMLGYAECKVEGFTPHEKGIALSITGLKSGKEYLIGALRVAASAKLVGAAGASVAAELSVEVDYSSLKSPGVKGARRPKNAVPTSTKVKLEDVAKDSGVSAGADAFAGVRASGEFMGALQYLNPEKGDKFGDMGAIGPKVEVQFGAGAAASLVVTYRDGKFRLKAKAGLCLGPGAKGEIGIEVDAKRLASFLEWLFHALLNAGFEFLQILLRDAFDAAVQLQVMMVSGLTDVYDDVQTAWGTFEKSMEREERRIALMNAVLSNPPTLRVCTPEAHGILLWQMTRHEWKTETLYLNANSEDWHFLGRRKHAVMQICRWAQCQSQFVNMVQHMGPTGGKGGFVGNYAGLKRFLDWHGGGYGDQLDRLYSSLPLEPARGYPVAMNDTHTFRNQALMGGSPIYLAMMGGGGLPNNVA